MAEEFKLKEDWNYRDLYIAILEDLAKRLKINRFQIYTVDRLIGKNNDEAALLTAGFHIVM